MLVSKYFLLGIGLVSIPIFAVLPVRADGPTDGVTSLMALPAVPVQELAGRLKEAFIKALPPELTYETRHNWGQQAEVPWIHGVRLVHATHNHGAWEKALVLSGPLARDLRVSVYDLQSLSDKQVALTVYVAAPATVRLNKQIWQSGIEVYSARVRARFQFRATFRLDVTASPEQHDFEHRPFARLQIKHATFSCDDFVAENINGLGGDFARLARPHESFWEWGPAVLGEFQKDILTGMATVASAREVQSNLDQLLANVPAARVAARQALAGAPVGSNAASADRLASKSDLTLADIPVKVSSPHSESRHASASAQSALPARRENYDKWGLAPRAIHYEPAASTRHGSQPSAATENEPARRR